MDIGFSLNPCPRKPRALYYVVAEVIAPVFQVLAVVTIPLAAVLGTLQWAEFVRVLAILALGSASFTCAAFILEERARHTFSARDLAYMVLLSPIELFFYRPVIMFAQLKGTVDFLRGDRSWNKFERNNRGARSPVAEPVDRRAA